MGSASTGDGELKNQTEEGATIRWLEGQGGGGDAAAQGPGHVGPTAARPELPSWRGSRFLGSCLSRE